MFFVSQLAASAVAIIRGKVKKPKTYGVSCIKYLDGHCEITSILEPILPPYIEGFKSLINNPGIDKENCYLVQWDEKSNKPVFIIGKESLVPGNKQKAQK